MFLALFAVKSFSQQRGVKVPLLRRFPVAVHYPARVFPRLECFCRADRCRPATCHSFAHAAEIRGKVTNVIGGEPLARVQVSVLNTKYQAITSGDGSFTIRELKAGSYTLRFEAVGYRLVTVPFSLADTTETKEFEVNLAPDNFRRTDSVVVTGDVFHGSDSPAVNAMILTSSEIKESSTVLADDPFRAIQSLPGVSPAGNNELYAEFIVMGAPFSTVGIYLDDVLIPSPFQTIPNELNGASLSMLTSETVQEMNLYPVAYPEKLGT